MAEDVLHVRGVEWDEMNGGLIAVLVPASARKQLADLVATRCGAGRSFALFDPADPEGTMSRWVSNYSEEGAYFFDDANQLVIPVPPSAAVRIAQAIDAGETEINFGDVRIAFA